jgi:hypothetical protein
MTVKFEVGQTYNMSLRGYDMGVAEITKRTEKSVWLKHEDGLTKRYKINILDEKEIVQAKNLFTISATNITKPQTTSEPVTESQNTVETILEPITETISKHTKFEIGGLYWKGNDDIMDLVIVTEICPDRGVCVNAMRRSGDTWITDDLQGYFFNPKIVNNKEVIVLNNGYHIKSDIPGDIMMYNAIVEIRAIDRQHTMEMLAEEFNTTFLDVSVTHHQTTLEPVTEPQDNQDTVTSPRLEILKKSLAKKEKLYDDKISAHFSDVRSANGQPLNDKRNGYQTLDRWERQNDSIRSTKAEIEKTKKAIEREEYKIENVNSWQEIFPSPITELLESGILTQWRKFPRIMFVKGVKKARITYDPKTGTISNSYVSEINNSEQYAIFRNVFNQLKKDLSTNL